MKIKNGFVLRKIADTYIVVAIGEEAKKANVMVTLNETGGLLWERLSKGAEKEELITALLNTYDVERELAEKDVEAFIQKLVDNGLTD